MSELFLETDGLMNEGQKFGWHANVSPWDNTTEDSYVYTSLANSKNTHSIKIIPILLCCCMGPKCIIGEPLEDPGIVDTMNTTTLKLVLSCHVLILCLLTTQTCPK